MPASSARRRFGRRSRGTARILLALTVIPLAIGAGSQLSAVADAAPRASSPHHKASAAPEQHWGSAASAAEQSHIKGGTPNTTLPPSQRSRYPLKTQPQTPKIRAATVRVATPAEVAAKPENEPRAKGFSATKSTELPTHRTADQREYRNQDGSLTTQFSATPINYRTADGSWAKIDTTLRPGSTFSSTAAPVGVRFARKATGDQLAAVSLDATHSLSFSLRGAKQVAGTAAGSQVQYKDVRKDADLELAATGAGAKETIVLQSAAAPSTYVFDLHLKGLTARLVGQSVVLADNAGVERATIPAGFMVDAGTKTRAPERSTGVTYRLVGDALQVTLDQAWLLASGRAFPVQVDPTVVTPPVKQGDAGSSMTVQGSDSSTDSQQLIVGDEGGSNAAAYVKFDGLVSALKNERIFGVQLNVAGYDAPSCKDRPLNVYAVDGSWTAGSGFSYPGPSLGSKLASSSFAYGYIATGKSSSNCPVRSTGIDLGLKGQQLVQGWVDGSKDNDGLSLRAAAGDSSAWKRIAGTGTQNPPSLFVTHSPYNATYAIAKQAPNPTVLQNQDGAIPVTVTNTGADSWTPGNYYLAYRTYNAVTDAPGAQVHSADLTATVPRGGKVKLTAKITKMPVGTYLLDFTMVHSGGPVFTDYQVPPARLEISVYDVPPVVQQLYPDNGYQAATLTPQLWAQAIDVDAATGLTYRFEICEVVAAGATQPACVIRDYASTPTWTLPTGTLAWSKTYKWRALVKDSNKSVVPTDYVNLLTSVPQPAVTSKVGGAPYVDKGQEFDPQIGNLTTASIEAPVLTAGPALNVQRTYNSLDPRRSNAFGAGWTTTYDMRVIPDNDGSGNVVVTYPDGQEVRFGKNADGTFAAPAGRVAGLTQNATSGVWVLQDRGGSKYTFDSSGKLTKIADAFGRAIFLTYDGTNHLIKAQTSGSGDPPTDGRALTFAWTGAHISSVSTDPVNGAPLTWTYSYDGDLLTQACAPGSACTSYDYGTGSHYRTAVLDDQPESYYRLGEDDGTEADSEVAVNLGKDTATYSNVTLGAAGVVAGSPDTAATFNGTSSSAALPASAIKRNRDQAIELWFKTPAGGTGGPLVGYQDKALTATSTLGVPAMYVGTDGKLRAQLAIGKIAPITSTTLVNDGGWHHAVLSASGTTQTLYLDGVSVGTLTGTISHDTLTANQLGAAYATTPASWPGWGSTARKFFTGTIDEAAFYDKPLGSAAVSSHYAFARTAADELTRVTLPSGKIASETTYDVSTDRVATYTDRHGGTWTVGAPLVYGSDTDLRRSVQVRDPANRPYLYEFDALAGRILRSGMPTGLTMREEDQPSPSPTDDPPADNCSQESPTDPVFCVLVPGDATGPVFYTLDGLSVRSYGYDADGNQNTITDENGDVTTLGYDTRGNVTSHQVCRTSNTDCYTDYSSYPSTVTNQFDPRNDMVTATRDGRSTSATDTTYLTSYTYTSGGNLSSQTNPDGGKVTNRYSTGGEFATDSGFVPPGLVLNSVDPLGASTQFDYNHLGDLVTVTEQSKFTTTYTYDVLGRKTSETEISDAYPSPGVTTTYSYDGLSRMTTMTEPVSTDAVTGVKHQRKTTYSYDADGNVTSTEVSDLLGGDAARRTSFQYDDFNNVSSVVDAEGNETDYGYDRFANMTSMTDPEDRRYEYGYTARNTLAQTRLMNWNGDPDQAPTAGDYLVLHSYTFDLGGRLVSDTDAMGRVLQYTYNLDNTLRQTTLKGFHNPDGSTRDVVVEADKYDGAGNNIQATAGNGTVVTENTYTPTGQVASTTVDPPGGIKRLTNFAYDQDGNVTETKATGESSNLAWPVVDESDIVKNTYDVDGRQTAQIVVDGASSRTTSYTYDERGLVTSVTDPRGNVTGATAADYTSTYGYDELGRRIKATAPVVDAESNGQAAASVHPSALTGYNTFDDTVETKDPLGNVSKATVDRLGQETSETGTPYTPPGSSTPITPVTSTQYDAVGNVMQQTDAKSNVTKYDYDQLDRMITEDDPTTDNDTRAISHYTYDRTGDVLSATDPKGAVVESTYDDLDRPITSTQVERYPSADNFTTSYGYDDAGNLTTSTSPTGAVTKNAYDPEGQLISTTDPSGVVTKHGYDGDGREVRLTDGLGRTARTDYDGFGQVSDESDLAPNGTTLREQTYNYDAVGNLTSAVSPLNTTRTYAYNALNELTQQTEPTTASHSITTSFGYDAAGNRTRYTDGRGNNTISTVNSWGMPESVVEPSTTAHPAAADRTWTVAYDADANPVKLTAPGGITRTRTFDAAGDLTEETGSGAAVGTTERKLSYDSDGELTSASAPGGTDSYSYDDRGLMLAASGPSGSAGFGYDGDGNLTNRTDAAGSATFGYVNGRLSTEKDGVTAATQTLGYDASGALSSIDYGAGRVRSFGYDDFGRMTSDTTKNSANATVASINYGYDLDDRMTSKNTTGTAGAGNNTYGYDLAGRLTSWNDGSKTTNYAWDDSGNRTQNGAKTASFDARNEVLSDGDYTYAYSPDGSVASRTSSGEAEPFSFDAFDRLITQGSSTYSYDGLDRLASQNSNPMLYDGTDTDVVSDGTETFARGAYDELLAIQNGTSKQTTLSDQHDDLYGAFDTTNTALPALDESTAFDPFGDVTATTGTTPDLGYQGDWTDPDTGQVDMGARWYSPDTGSFDSQDAAQYTSGPSILANGYTYAAGDPMDQTDPDGNWPSCGWCKKAASAVSHGVSAVVSAVRSGAEYVAHSVMAVARTAWSAVKAVARVVASAARSVYNRARAAATWVANKVASAARWAASRAAAAASWARAKAEAAKRAAIARAKAVTAKAKKAEAYAISHNPLPAAKALLKPLMTGIKVIVSATANLPANVVAMTEDVIQDAAKSTQAIYQKALDKAGTVIDDLSTAASAAGEFVQGAIPMMAGIAAGIATTAACEAVTAGVGSAACLVAGFAVGGAVTSALDCAPGRSKLGCAAQGGAEGVVAGLVTVATAGVGDALFAGAEGGAAVEAGASEAVESGAGEAGEAGEGEASEGAGSCRTNNSFVPGTGVLMADGSTKPIEDVRIGDKVLATDPTTGKTSVRPVTDVIVGFGEKRLVALTLDTDGKTGHRVETVTATDGHPFWVDGNGEQFSARDAAKDPGGHWVTAGDLRTGDRLQTPKGDGTVAVLDSSTRTELHTVYNLTVDGVHTYYIQTGDTDVLVHNQDCGPSGAISMDRAVELGAEHVEGTGKMVVSGSKAWQFISSTKDAAGRQITRIARFDINPNVQHVKDLGPHLNLETQINGRSVRTGPLADPHIPIDFDSVRPGDLP